ncbi:MAG: hypothetical protein HMLKMBBP_03550 [Planctomycetes bacterium]|nr:hypothetical protein [Planctomycetota bacterium]
MRPPHIPTLLLASVLCLAPVAGGAVPAASAQEAPAAPAWFPDFDQALAAARQAGKTLLVEFTGTDWCHWCAQLDAEVLSKPEFAAAATSYVLCRLDFPNGDEAKARVPNPARNAEIAKSQGVTEYPTVLLFAPEGDVLAMTGYEPGGAAKWVDQLAKLERFGKRTRDDAAAMERDLAAAGTPEARSTVIARAVDFLERKDESPVRRKRWNAGPGRRIAAIAAQASQADPQDAAGLQSRALRALFASRAAGDAEIRAARALDADNRRGLLEMALLTDMQAAKDDESGSRNAPFVESAVTLAKTGTLRDADYYVPALVQAAFTAKDKLGDMKTARLLVKTLRTLGPKDDARLERMLKQIVDKD